MTNILNQVKIKKKKKKTPQKYVLVSLNKKKGKVISIP
jgi:phage repressor protein C with HTH and peptisase S24 domain